MPYTKLNKTGCCERYGNLQLRIDFFLEEDDPRYFDRYIQVPVIPKGGYTGKVDEVGSPLAQKAYDKWFGKLPLIWQLTPFHSHFFYADPNVTDAEIKAEMDFHLPNFYTAFQNEWDKVQGGMRHGFAVEKRKRPVRYSKTLEAAEYLNLKTQVDSRLALITSIESKPISLDGKEYPSTDIDIGYAAVDGTGSMGFNFTVITLDNPANATGVLDTIEIWAETTMGGTKAGTFYGSGTDYTSRDVETIGTVTAGSKQTFTGLNCNVETGDYIGIYYSSGRIERFTTTGAGICYIAGDQFGTGTQTYTSIGGCFISLYGTGETPVVVAPTVTTQAATSIEDTTATGNGNITATGGANATRRGFCYKVGTSGDPTTADSVAYDDGSFGTGAYTKAITGLTQGTGYRVRAYAVNTAGTGYGATVQITTPSIYEESVSDGFEAGETIAQNLVVDLTRTDGLKPGDSLAPSALFPKSVSDGAKIGEGVGSATLTLRPNAAGDETSIQGQYPSSTFHWDKVDEAVADDNTTHVYEGGAGAQSGVYVRDLYALPAHSGTGVINSIKVYYRCHLYSVGPVWAKASILTHSTNYDEGEEELPLAWTTYSYQWNTNPNTSNAWTWAEIDALEIGVSLKQQSSGMAPGCTQVYVVVDYTPSSPVAQLEANPALTDGMKAGDTSLAQAIFGNLLTDGIKLSDLLSIKAALDLLVSDGIELSETLATQFTANPALTDGASLGDTPTNIGAFGMSVADGLELSDVPVIIKIINLLLSEEVKLSEELVTQLIAAPALTDGVKLGDTTSGSLLLNLSLSDGTKFSDTPLAGFVYDMTLTDGAKLSEALAIIGILNVSVADGVKLGDTPLANAILNLALTDGVTLSDKLHWHWLRKALKLAPYSYTPKQEKEGDS